MSRKLRLILFLIGLTVVSLMVWKAGPDRLWEGLRGSLWVAVALIPLWATVYLLNAMAWRQLTSAGGEPIPLLHALRMTVIAFAVMFVVWVVYFQAMDWLFMKIQGLDYFFLFR